MNRAFLSLLLALAVGASTAYADVSPAERAYAEGLAAGLGLELGEVRRLASRPFEPPSAGVSVRLDGLLLRRVRYEDPRQIRVYPPAEVGGQARAGRWVVREVRGRQVLTLAGPRLADPALRERARALAWAGLNGPDAFRGRPTLPVRIHAPDTASSLSYRVLVRIPRFGYQLELPLDGDGAVELELPQGDVEVSILVGGRPDHTVWSAPRTATISATTQQTFHEGRLTVEVLPTADPAEDATPRGGAVQGLELGTSTDAAGER